MKAIEFTKSGFLCLILVVVICISARNFYGKHLFPTSIPEALVNLTTHLLLISGIIFITLGNAIKDSSDYFTLRKDTRCPRCHTALLETTVLKRIARYSNKLKCPMCNSIIEIYNSIII